MDFVDYDYVVLGESRVGLDLAEEDTFGQEEDFCVTSAGLFETYLFFWLI